MAVRDDEVMPVRNDIGFKYSPEYLALAVSFIGAMIFVVRCIVVSRNDPFTAAALIGVTSIGGAVRVVMFSVIAPLSYLLGAASLWSAGLRMGQRILGRRLGWPLTMLLLLAGIACMTFAFYYNGGFGIGLWSGLSYVLFFLVLSVASAAMLAEVAIAMV